MNSPLKLTIIYESLLRVSIFLLKLGYPKILNQIHIFIILYSAAILQWGTAFTSKNSVYLRTVTVPNKKKKGGGTWWPRK